MRPLERAFQLATTGVCRSVDEIRRTLKAEGYSDAQLSGASITRQLRGMIEDASEAKRKAETEP